MALRTPFVELIEAGLREADTPSMNALALKWGVPAQYVARWRYDAQLPELWRVPILAARIGIPARVLEQHWFDSAKLLSLAKRAEATVPPPVGERRRANHSLPPVRPRARRRKLTAWVFAVASASLLGGPPAVAGSRLITAGPQVRANVADLKDSVAFRRRRRVYRRATPPAPTPTRWAA